MAERPDADVLVSGSEREPGQLWPRLPRAGWAALAVAAVVVAVVVVQATGVGRPDPVPPQPLAELGPVAVRVDDGGLLVRVEAEVRAREPVVLRSGTVTGGALVVLGEPTPTAASGDQAVRSQAFALLDPDCPVEVLPPRSTVLELVVAPQDGGEPVVLTGDVPARALDAALTGACAPVRASATLPPGSGAEARALDVTVRVPEATGPLQVLGLTGRGFQVDAAALAEQLVAASALGRPFEVTAPVRVTVGDCLVDVQAPRRLVLEVQRGDERRAVAVQTGPEVVAGLDELVRRSCRRARG